MSVLDGVRTKASTSGEFLQFFLKNKWWWLTLMLVLLLAVGIVIVLAETSAIAPFIYTLF